MPNNLPTVEQRFWSKVNKDGECWVWTGSTNDKGYGYFQFNGKVTKAHRASWELHNGPIPDGLCVLHKCDNPSCIRPLHLFIGTKSDNAIDMVTKGRHHDRKGENHPRHKLSGIEVLAIRKLLDGGMSQAKAGRTTGANFRTVHLIAHRKIWAHI